MLDIIDCIFGEHNLWLVLLAAVICALSVATTLQAYERGVKNSGRARLGWLATAGAVGGAGVWATHFVAMLAYSPSLPIQYNIGGTAISLLIGMSGAAAGFHVAAMDRGRPLVGGALVGLSIVAMHYVGISAIESTFRIQWSLTFVIASVAVSLAGAAAALKVQRGGTDLRTRIGAGVLLLLAIVGLHFTGMTAVKLIPTLGAAASPELMSRPVLAILVGGMVFLILFAALALIVAETQSNRASLGALQVAFQGVPSGIALYSPEGRLELWNEAFKALMDSFGVELVKGADRAALMRATIDGAARASDGPIEFEQVIDSPLTPWEGELPDGRWLRVERQLLPNGSIITVMSDVTNLRRWADAMQEARDNAEAASRAKSDFLANMSHEIRTPLNGVLGMIQAMERDELTPAQRQRVAVAHESGKALLGTLNDILDLAKVQSGHMELEAAAFDAAELGESVCTAFAGAATVKGLDLTLDVDPSARGWWLGDTLKLRQILSNLVANALKFTLDGGVTLGLKVVDGQLVLSVKDTGIGIDPRDAERLFEKFAQADSSTTRKFGGTGLGLAICRELTDLMGGRIWIESTPGEGATFILAVTLDRTDAPEALPEAAPHCAEEFDADQPLNILVAEDNPVNQLVLQSLLEPVNVALTLVGNGQEAVTAFTTGRFDAVLMDIQMPEMNGIEATRLIRALEARERRPRTPIIALTANVMHDQLEEYSAVGMDTHVAKPIEVERLYAALSAAMEPQAADEAVAA